MKKILALTLTGILVIGCAAFAACGGEPDNSEETGDAVTDLYFVPGTYVADGVKVENTISSGAKKLTDEECGELFTENLYQCTLSAGTALPTPSSDRVDGEGAPYVFNGWWTIVNATVTYFETVPKVTETTYLYADWRADLSQRKDPIIPDDYVAVEPNHYMLIQRADSSGTEKVTLRKSYTNETGAEKLGYERAVQLVVKGLELNVGDVITVYTTGLDDSEEAVITPFYSTGSEIRLDKSGDNSNNTADYLTADKGSARKDPYLTCIADGSYNLYIKYFAGGYTMAVYMEPAGV